jgi:hypothetical protein
MHPARERRRKRSTRSCSTETPISNLVHEELGVGGMILVLIGIMLSVLVAAMVLSKGRSFFRYAEMSRGLPREDVPSRRLRQKAAR